MNNLLCIMLITSSFTILAILCVLYFKTINSADERFKYVGKTGVDLSKLYAEGHNVDFINRISSENTYNDNIGIGPILIINLDKDKERLHHLLSQCNEENLYAIKGGNCCGNKISPEENSRFIYNDIMHGVGRGRYLVPGEKKCFLSHEQCWKKAATQKLPSLIVEDDVSFPYDSAHILKHIVDDINHIIDSGGPPAITVRLGSSRSENTGKLNDFAQVGDTCLGESDFRCGTWAYIVTPEAAKALLKVSAMNNLKWPADHIVNPPAKRDSFLSYEKRIPDQSEYMFLEVIPEEVGPIKSRYKLGMDRDRTIVIQELSTDMKMSRSYTK